ncbi:hypothetical protein [Anaerobiospirillum sp. NML120511]|nr:hypothetical protein [Anaerobiospirillum sp. NML120511]
MKKERQDHKPAFPVCPIDLATPESPKETKPQTNHYPHVAHSS